MKFTKKNEHTRKTIGSLTSGTLFFQPNENDIYVLLASHGIQYEGANLSTGEVERFDKLLNVIPVDGELIWHYCDE